MTVEIKQYSEVLKQMFHKERSRLKLILPENVVIEHVGSSSVGIGGKNIVDILIGAKKKADFRKIRDILVCNGYYEGHDSHEDRLFLASRPSETRAGDVHIHICLTGSPCYEDFLILRKYLLNHPTEAKLYYEKKKEFAFLARYDRKEYKKLKSSYVSELLDKARQEDKEAN